jgi:pimeloyl-ACP methyl ester carboxylesterase
MKNNSIYKSDAGKKEIMSFYDSVLSNWPVAYETKIISTRHGDTFVIICGNENAPSLILLHGAASNATSWVGDILEYSRHFKVYLIDILGEPGKSSENRPSWQELGYAEWLNDVFNEMKIEKSSLLGISQGAWTALRFATCYPERVEKLVLLTPAGIVKTKVSFIIKAIFYSLFGKAGMRKLNRIVFGEQPIHQDAIKFMDLIMIHFKSRIEKEYIFKDTELQQLRMPVLLIGGTEDVIRSSETIAKRMKNQITNLTSIIIPQMGHVLVNISQHIIPFLNDTKR